MIRVGAAFFKTPDWNFDDEIGLGPVSRTGWCETMEFMREYHPVDVVEDVADEQEWSFQRHARDEISILAKGTWADYSLSFSWMEDFEALHIACAFDMRVPQRRVSEAHTLVTQINEQLLVGHFELWTDDGTVMFRHTLPLNGGAVANEAQVECMKEAALTACERYYQSFQYVVWAGHTAGDALSNVLFDTVGQA